MQYVTLLRTLVDSSTRTHSSRDALQVAMSCYHALQFIPIVSHGPLAQAVGDYRAYLVQAIKNLAKAAFG